MGKRMRMHVLCLLLVIFVWKTELISNFGAAVVKATEIGTEEGREEFPAMDVAVEQIYARMPEVYICIGGEDSGNLIMEDIVVYRDSEMLKNISMTSLAESSCKSNIYLLLDVSLSINAKDFEAAKKAICQLYRQRSENEKIAVVTFGDTVELILDGTEDTDVACGKVESIERNSQNTALFEGIHKVTELAESRQTEEFIHTLVIVITDGMDTALGSATLQEAENGLKRQGMSLYGLIEGSGERESINRFGEFARSTGGKMETWNADNMEAMMTRILLESQSVQLLIAAASDNRVSYSMEPFTVMFQQWNIAKNHDVYVGKWVPDQESPRLLYAGQEGDNQVTVTFSEPLEGMENASNYQLRSDSVLYVPVSVKIKEPEQVQLSFAEGFISGSYTLSCVNMTDISMEKNSLTNEVEIFLSGTETVDNEAKDIPAVETGESMPEYQPDGNQLWIIIMAVGCILLLFMLLIFLGKKRKKTEVADEGAENGNEVVLEHNILSKKHVIVQKRSGINLILYPQNCGKVQPIHHCMVGAVIIGRSDVCEIYFDDALMSRQHFALEYENGIMIVQDLEAANGTYVNGVRIQGRRVLEKRDVISAGSMDLMVDWRTEENA